MTALRPYAEEPDTRVDLPLSRPYGADAGLWLVRLRAGFPHWGFLFDPGRSVWVAVRGRHRIEVAPTAIELRDALTTRGRRH